MPKDLPPGSICYDYWRLLTDGGHLERINHVLVMEDREKAGRGRPVPPLSSSMPNQSNATLRKENGATMLRRKWWAASVTWPSTPMDACSR